ncbi:MAG TPA: 4-hydroxy-tetrahydrodipicolinate reductase [Nannocystis exedens]|nr:4-hydroxy-tetrahydrodipicolinate reductase [Nannocystis exedens]
MSEHLTPVIIVGARGRMGRVLIREVAESDIYVLTGAVDRSGGPGRGIDAGKVAGTVDIGVTVTDELRPRRAVVVDFSLPQATVGNIRRCVEAGVPLVLGTTGICGETRRALAEAAKTIPIVSDANFSVGISLLSRLAGLAARALGQSWDAEILEIHHKHKRDAPSGTALRLGKTVAKATDRKLADVLCVDRSGSAGEPRKEGEIGIVALRGGDSVGEHTLIFLADGERIELTHRATDRAIFARGALRAARWVESREPGLYSMADVLGLAELH